VRLSYADAALVWDGDLAVEDEGRRSGGGERVEGCVEDRGSVAAVAGEEAHRVDDGDETVAVLLDLLEPAGAAGRLGARCDKLWVDVGRQGSRDRLRGSEKFRHRELGDGVRGAICQQRHIYSV
jgi:hypothetical protein